MEGFDSIVKAAISLGGVGVLISWLYKRDDRIESKLDREVNALKQALDKRPTKEQVRQTVEDLNKPMVVELEYIKKAIDQSQTKLDRLLQVATDVKGS